MGWCEVWQRSYLQTFQTCFYPPLAAALFFTPACVCVSASRAPLVRAHPNPIKELPRPEVRKSQTEASEQSGDLLGKFRCESSPAGCSFSYFSASAEAIRKQSWIIIQELFCFAGFIKRMILTSHRFRSVSKWPSTPSLRR